MVFLREFNYNKLIGSFAIVLFSAYTCTAMAQDTLHWTATDTLSWNDFKGKPNISSSHLAISSTGISYSLHSTENDYDYTVAAFFNRSLSWRKPTADLKILKHEQGHFDITEIFARKVDSALHQLHPDRATIKTTIDQLVKKYVDEKNEYQRKYDLETSFGTNVTTQLEWEVFIRKQLEK